MDGDTGLRAFLRAHRVRQFELAAVLGLTPAAISRKLAGDRPLLPQEAEAIRGFVSGRIGRAVSSDELFGREAVA